MLLALKDPATKAFIESSGGDASVEYPERNVLPYAATTSTSPNDLNGRKRMANAIGLTVPNAHALFFKWLPRDHGRRWPKKYAVAYSKAEERDDYKGMAAAACALLRAIARRGNAVFERKAAK
jgi:hypothetical protein